MNDTLELDRLEVAVTRALATGDHDDLHVLGYGEITCVLAWPDRDGPWACKRLPAFDSEARLVAFRTVFDGYLDALRAAGVSVHDSRIEALPLDRGEWIAYCVQPTLAPSTLAPARLREAGPEDGRRLLATIAEHIGQVTTAQLGFDAHLSNWAAGPEGTLVYLDVTTPLQRDAAGRDLLDTELFLASLPAVTRPPVRRFLTASILDPYFQPRAVALDLLANLRREDLAEWIPVGVEVVNARLGTDIDVDEVHAHYRRDARLWSALQRLRRIDRWWQRQVRRRTYPFLLPETVDRRL